MDDEKPNKPVEAVRDKVQQAINAETAPSHVRHYRSYVFTIILAGVTVAFGLLTFLVKTVPAFAVDLQITQAVQSLQYGPFRLLMIFISWPGFWPQSALLTLLILLFLLGLGLWWETVAALVAAVVDIGVNVLVKDLIQRPRPATPLVHVFVRLTDFSFPSGHVMYYVGFLGFIGFLAFTLLKDSLKRTLILIVIAFFIFLIGVSRIYEGEHWASDVLGAYLLGSLLLVGLVQFYRWGKARFFVRQPSAQPGSAELKVN